MEKDVPGKFQQQSWCGYINISKCSLKREKIIRAMAVSKIGI